MDLHVKVGVSPIHLLRCINKNCEGHGQIDADIKKWADIRLGQNKVQDVRFSCNHIHRIVLER